jgi:hypothetical protein
MSTEPDIDMIINPLTAAVCPGQYQWRHLRHCKLATRLRRVCTELRLGLPRVIAQAQAATDHPRSAAATVAVPVVTARLCQPDSE